MKEERILTHSVNSHYISFAKNWSHIEMKHTVSWGLQPRRQTPGTLGDEGMYTEAMTGQWRRWQACSGVQEGVHAEELP